MKVHIDQEKNMKEIRGVKSFEEYKRALFRALLWTNLGL
jgi:hypothetical protein